MKRGIYILALIIIGILVWGTSVSWGSWRYVESETEATTSSTTYQTKAKLVSDTTGYHLIILSWEIGSNSTSISAQARVTKNASAIPVSFIEEMWGGTTYYRTYATHFISNLAVNDSIKIEYRTGNSAATTRIKRARIVAIPLVSGTYGYVEGLDILNLGTTWTNTTSLNIQPATAGDYLIIGSLELKANNTSANGEVRMNLDNLTWDSTSAEGESTADRIAFFSSRIVNLNTSSHTIRLQARSDAGNNTDVYHPRISVIRLTDVFRSFSQAENLGETSTTNGSDNWVNRVTHNYTPPISGNYLVMASSRLKTTAGSSIVPEHRWTVAGTEQNKFITPVADNTDYLPHLGIRRFNWDTTQKTLQLDYTKNSSGTEAVYIKYARILTLSEAPPNRPPVLASIGPKSVNEGQTLQFRVSATDPDGGSLILSAQSVPSHGTFVDSGNGAGSFTFNPDYTQAGIFNVRFIVSDAILADSELVQITVNNVNRPPVLASIGPKSVNEGQTLQFRVSATDPDGGSLILSALSVPSHGTFVDSGNGAGSLTFNPDYTQAGIYNVNFISSDGSLADSEMVQITVNNVNRPPVLASIGPKSVNEGQTLQFRVSATDPDGGLLILSAQSVPSHGTFVDSGNGAGSFTFNPDYTQAGIFNVRFIVSDAILADSELVQITVNNVNRPPVLASIGPKSVNEGQTLQFRVSATDPDGGSLVLSALSVPSHGTFVDSGNGAGSFTFNPDYTQAGIFNVRFIVSDAILADSELVQITVNNVNRPPVLASIGPKSVNEGQTLQFRVSATDPDGGSLILSAQSVPSHGTFVDSGNGAGSFTFNPDYTQAGIFNVRFIVSDAILADSELVQITVNNVNRPPVLASIGPKSVNEGQTLQFRVSATDPDGGSLILSALSVPSHGTFVDSGNGAGSLTFNPDYTQAGIYNVNFISSDGSLADSEMVQITVNNVNRPPVLASIGPKSVNEGQTLQFRVSATDPDGGSLILSAQSVPSHGTFVDSGNGAGSFTFNPDYTQAGIFNVRFIVSDAILADSELVQITVNNVNRPPVLASIGPKSVNEGQTLQFRVSATDPDGGSLVLSALSVPSHGTFVDSGNGAGSFTFNPDYTQAGIFNVRFIVSDAILADSELVQITVNNVNRPPVLASIGPKSVNEGQTLQFRVSATDPDGNPLTLSALSVPTNATFADSGNGAGSLTFNPDYTQAGIYNVNFISSDGSLADSELVQITVNNVNRPPVLASIGPKSVNEGQTLQFRVSATDPDGGSLILSALSVPSHGTFVDSGNGAGSLTFNPDYTQAGIYNVNFISSDGSLADSEMVQITVSNVNRPPVLASIGPKSVNEGQTLQFRVSATDPDGGSLILSALSVPTHGTFVDSGNGAGSLTFNPDYTQAGIYNVNFISSDGSLADSELVQITVNNANRPPVLASIGPKSVNEGQTLQFRVSATDPDGNPITLSALNVPTNATFTDSTNGAGSLTFNPDYTQAGIYNVNFISSDGSLADSEMVQITVNNANRPPVLASIGPKSVNEGQTLQFRVSATDPDGGSLILSALSVPTHGTFVDSGNGAGSLTFNPDYTQAGIFNVRFIASDGALADSELVQITVNNVNRPPVLASIGPKSVNEGQTLQFRVSATDPDGGSLILSALSVPTHGTFVDSGNGAGSLTFNPDYTQAGIYNVNFISSDGSLADSELVQITVSNVNRPPVLASIGPKSVNEGQTLQFRVSATDPDGNPLTLSALSVPTNATFADSGNGAGSLTFNPDYTQAGIYNVNFISSDGSLADSELVQITVNNVNRPPVLASIGPKSVNEGQTLQFRVSATDPDGGSLILSALSVPSHGTFVDSGNGAGSLTFNPDYTQAGIYNVNFISSDGSLADSEMVQITVNNVNRPPVLASIGPKSVNEGQTLQFRVSATDPDGNPLTLSALSVPTNATFADSGNGAGSLTFNPDYTQAGIYNVNFISSDGSLADSEMVQITVNNVNRPPVLASIGPKSVNEGQTLQFRVSATDPDGGSLILSALSVPTHGTFVDSGNGAGSLTFNPDYTQAGIYNVNFISSDGSLADSELVQITVNNANRPPVLASIGPKSVNEGQTLQFRVSATDPDGNPLTLSALSVPTNATFADSGNGAGSLTFNPDYTQAGIFNVRFIASDGALADSELVQITVNNVNRPPVLASIDPKSVNEGQTLQFRVSATDPDGNPLTLSALSVPTNATFADSGNGAGSLTFNPDYTQAGIYNVNFISSDGSLADSELVQITVNNANRPPVLASIGPKSVNEGQTLQFRVSATDPDGNPLTLSALSVPTNATFADSGNGAGSLTFNPDYTQAGIFNVRFIASDGALADSELVQITVNNVNRPPVLASIDPKSVNEGQTLQFRVSATDPDGNPLTLSALSVPTNATFADSGNGAGSLTFNPDYTQAGIYNVNFISSDGSLADSELVQITVNNANRPPVLASIGPKSVNEGQTLQFRVSATDPDGNPLTLSALSVPTNATFADSGNGAGSFTFSPDYNQSGVYNVTFIALDGSLADSEIVEITVNGVNRAPVLASIGPKSVNEGQTLQFRVSATDPDGNPITLSALNVPTNATFTDSTNGAGSLTFNPDYTQAGIYNVNFISSDGSLADSEIVEITVNGVNRAPVLASIGPKSVNEGQTLQFRVSATDPDGGSLILSALSVPSHGTFVDSGNGAGSLTFNPDYTQAGIYNVNFISSDGSLADSEMVQITVNNVNRPPVLASIGPKSVNEGQTLQFRVSATDPDGGSLILSALSVPSHGTFVDSGNGAGSLTFNPDYTQAGIYNVNFISSDGSLADSELVQITVNNVNRPPVLASIGPKSVNEGQTLQFRVSATDPDGNPLTLSALSVPTNATFADSGNGAGSLTFNPDYTQAGIYSVNFISLDGSLADSEIVEITVNGVNRAPVLASIGSKTVDEMQVLQFRISGTDPDGDSVHFSVVDVPTNATFTDSGNGSGSFVFNPSDDQSGIYNVTFIALDGSLADSEIVEITVNGVNRAPVLASIGSKTVDEMQVLQFRISGTDPDGDSVHFSVVDVPTNATFTDSGNGSGSFVFNPSDDQSGIYNVTFIALDGSLADSEIVEITVNGVNRAPVLASIGSKTVDEMQTLQFRISGTDPDGDSVHFSVVDIPTNATFTDSGNGSGSFVFNPSDDQSGIYNVTFIALDGSLADSEIVEITVNGVNRAPVLASIGSKTVDEMQVLQFRISGTDPDGDSVHFSVVDVPTNATFTDSGNGSGSFVFNPSDDQSGIYNVTFIALDGSLADSEIVEITVNGVNRAPVLASIGSKTVDEMQTLQFRISGTDPDGDSVHFSVVDIPTNATFTDSGNGSGSFVFNPSDDQSGIYNVTFIALDGSLADSEIVEITVNGVNRAPVLASIGPKSVNEGQTLQFRVSATDPDGGSLILSALSVPSHGTFVDSGNGAGSLTFNPDYTQAGIYNVNFISSDGSLADSEMVQITVNNVNRPPVLASIGPKSVNEGQTLQFRVSATDPDGNPLTLSALSVPTNATFADSGNGAGSLTFNPDYTQAGIYNVNFISSDGSLADSEMVQITVNNANRPPVLASIGPKSVNDGQTLQFRVSATDPDGNPITLSAQSVPTNATFTDSGNGAGSFTFSPDYNQSGVYNVTFIALDGSLADSEIVEITVNGVNRAPVLASIGPKSVNEGQTLQFRVSATDPDGNPITLSAQNVPTNGTFVDSGNGAGSLVFNPDYTQAGIYSVNFISSDGSLADSELVQITVNNANRPPVLASIGSKTVDEMQTLQFRISGTDPDGDSVHFSVVDIPTNATFTDSGNGSGSFVFNPSDDQSGIYNVTFIALDGSLADSEIVEITVNGVNRAPVLASIGSKTVDEMQTLQFRVSATDPDGGSLILSALSVPSHGTFVDSGNGAGSFTFSPDYNQSGVYNVTFIALDGSLADSEIVEITVNGVNRAPVLASIGSKTVDEMQVLQFRISGTDPDGDSVHFSVVDVPTNATFADSGNGAGSFTFSPDYNQSGVYNVTFIALDGSLADSEIVEITVNGVNRAPVLASIGPKSVNEGQTLQFRVSATDPDGNPLTLSALSVPTNATFADSGNGAGSLTFNPDYTQAGIYNVNFISSDGSLADSELVQITVNNANRPPVLASIGSKTVDEMQVLQFRISGTDPDGDSVHFSVVDVPTNATFADSGNGAGSLVFNPDYTQSGIYNVTFISSDGSLADSEIVEITVNGVNRAPVLASIGSKTVDEMQVLQFRISGTDPDGDSVHFSVVDVPTNATFADSGNGAGSLTFNPDYTQAGIYNVNFISSDGSLADSELVQITVNNANRPPVLASIGSKVVDEMQVLQFRISGTDPDGDSVHFSVVDIPTNATFADSGNGAGSFTFNPSDDQSGIYNVTFIALDGSLADSEIVEITVNDADNQAPVLDAIGSKMVVEGNHLEFRLHASDADSDPITLSALDVPLNGTFTDSGNGSGSFAFDPSFVQAGIYNVTFIASDGSQADSETVPITVDNVDLPPVLDSIGPQMVQETETLAFRVSASDPDGDSVALSVKNAPTNATFTDSGNGAGSFIFTPDSIQSGIYYVTFTASSAVLTDSEVVQITVSDFGNHAPMMDAIGPKAVMEGGNLKFRIHAVDIDLDSIILSALDVPVNAIFVDSGNGAGSFTFTPDSSQSGIYHVTCIASDASLADSEVVDITVTEWGNHPPVLDSIGPKAMHEGDSLIFTVTASDSDGTIPILTASSLPDNATFTDNHNGHGLFVFHPTFYQAGVETVTFQAIDMSNPPPLSDLEKVVITILDFNQAPTIDTIGPKTIQAGYTLRFRVVGHDSTDPDGGPLHMSAVDLPLNSTYHDSGGGVGGFTFTPDYSQAGVDTVTFFCTDEGTPPLSGFRKVEITVTQGADRAPVLDAIGFKLVTEGATLQFRVHATDPDGTTPILYTSLPLPQNASFVDSANGAGSFRFTPSFLQAGLYQITFYAGDGQLSDYELVMIQVVEAGNQAPVLDSIGPQSVLEGDSLKFRVHAVDPEGNPITLSIRNNPANSSLADSGNGSGAFRFNPGFNQSGIYTVTFKAIDSFGSPDSELVQVTVIEAGNQPPALSSIGPKEVIERQWLIFTVTANDPDGNIPTLRSFDLPPSASFTDNHNGTGSFVYRPTFYEQGVYYTRFEAVDSVDTLLRDWEIVQITVSDSNQFPTVTIYPDSHSLWRLPEARTCQFRIIGTDADSTFPFPHIGPLPANATLVDSGNGVGLFTFTPAYNQGGAPAHPQDYSVTPFVVDRNFPSDTTRSAPITIIVYDSPEPPNLVPLRDTTIVEGQNLNIHVVTIYTVDVPTLQATGRPSNSTFTDSGNGRGAFRFTPGFTQGDSTYLVRFIAQNKGLADTETVHITVVEWGQMPPVLAPLPDSIEPVVRDTFKLHIYATDPDGPSISLKAVDLPDNSSFADSGNGGGIFEFYPDSTQLDSVYHTLFIASDGTFADSEMVVLHVVSFLRGDANSSGEVELGDLVYLINYLYKNGPAPVPLLRGDANCDGVVNLGDIVLIINYLFRSGPPPGC